MSHRTTRCIRRAEIARARERCAGPSLGETGRFAEQDVNLRRVYVHMIEGYAQPTAMQAAQERIDRAPVCSESAGLTRQIQRLRPAVRVTADQDGTP